MIVRSQYNFIAIYNPMAKNRYVKGVKKFLGADKLIHKVAYFQSQAENKDKVYTVHYEVNNLELIETPVTTFIRSSDIPFHRIMLFKCDGEIIWDRKNKFSTIWRATLTTKLFQDFLIL